MVGNVADQGVSLSHEPHPGSVWPAGSCVNKTWVWAKPRSSISTMADSGGTLVRDRGAGHRASPVTPYLVNDTP